MKKNQSNIVQNDLMCLKCIVFYANPDYEGLCSVCHKDVKKLKMQPQNYLKKSIVEKEAKSELENETINNQLEVKIDNSKCGECSKKVSIRGFKCRCKYTFCKKHRMPEDHDCNFDYVSKGKAEIIDKNKVVKASKIEGI